jgi:hypothetical protein
MEVIRSSETSVHTRSTRRHIPEDGILHEVFCLCIVSALSVLGCVKSSVLHTGNNLRHSICALYSWEMALNIDFDVSFDNMHDGGKRRKLMAGKLIQQMVKLSFEFSAAIALVSKQQND